MMYYVIPWLFWWVLKIMLALFIAAFPATWVAFVTRNEALSGFIGIVILVWLISWGL